MKVLIVEDERLAADNLVKIHDKIGYIEVLDVLESIYEVLEWFKENDEPELLFLDIHLADGSSFEVFDKIEITCPVIFTSAYDEYALKAFQVNSIDYLLKLLDFKAVDRALEKHRRLTFVPNKAHDDLKNFIKSFKKRTTYKSSFLIPVKGDKLIPLKVDEIAYFFIDLGSVKAVTEDEKSYVIDNTLDEIMNEVNPDEFFRANRQFIISRKSVKDIDLWFNQRLSVNLKTKTPDKIIVSKARISEFKKWFEL